MITVTGSASFVEIDEVEAEAERSEELFSRFRQFLESTMRR